MADIPEPFSSVLITIAKYLDDPQRGGQFYERDIKALHPYNINLAVIRAGINWLVDEQYLFLKSDPTGPGENPALFYEFSASAAVYVYEKSRPVELNAYEPLSLDRDCDELSTTLGLIESIQERVRGNNGLAPKVRDSLSASLSAGIQLLRSAVPTRAQLEATLFKPLTWLSVQFAKAELGELAKEAATHLSKFLGL